MKTLAGAAIGALVLAAAAPAFAGGYWDLREGPPGPPPSAYDGPPCERACPPPEPPCPPPRHREVYRQEQRWEGPPPEAEDVVVPAEFFETEGGVGPAFEYDGGGGGGGGFGESDAFGGAESFASASASARVSVDVRVREMQRMMNHQHQMMMQHHMMMQHRSYGGRW